MRSIPDHRLRAIPMRTGVQRRMVCSISILTTLLHVVPSSTVDTKLTSDRPETRMTTGGGIPSYCIHCK